MSQPDPPSFHLRLPPELKAQLQAARGRNSLNREIIERLERTFDSDLLQLAGLLQPFLVKLNAEERAKLLGLAAEAVDIVARRSTKKRP
ncbi:hypothetical protein OHD62_17465 [Mesorhizobium sp. YC-39]|uniref:hypothetical protein n=1 Tax=unclassified Mesorhizobium TaxID=325217 RepID=UPI0021E94D86|nr:MULTISPECIES: hypothetical protein [unclassified Mesorhizobium]MCV3209633.1 hypothetical protein [Mesorhizobium sp. YC-2]MCV3230163.1 hypothetical protein [Mesorhizobium sp. YC-39]